MKARIYYQDGTIQYFDDQKIAYAVWLALPRRIRAAFRGADDSRAVYSWDYVTY